MTPIHDHEAESLTGGLVRLNVNPSVNVGTNVGTNVVPQVNGGAAVGVLGANVTNDQTNISRIISGLGIG